MNQKGNWITILVCNNSSIDMTVAQAMNREILWGAEGDIATNVAFASVFDTLGTPHIRK